MKSKKAKGIPCSNMREFDKVMEGAESQPSRTPTRCKDCRWVDEADSIKQTSYKGVEFCALHNRAVNSHGELLEAIKGLLEFGILSTDDGWKYQRISAVDKLRNAIAKTEGK